VGRARRSGTNSAPVRAGPRVPPEPVGDGCTAAPQVVAHVGSRCRPTTGPVGIRRTANTATTRPYPARRTTGKIT